MDDLNIRIRRSVTSRSFVGDITSDMSGSVNRHMREAVQRRRFTVDAMTGAVLDGPAPDTDRAPDDQGDSAWSAVNAGIRRQLAARRGISTGEEPNS